MMDYVPASAVLHPSGKYCGKVAADDLTFLSAPNLQWTADICFSAGKTKFFLEIMSYFRM